MSEHLTSMRQNFERLDAIAKQAISERNAAHVVLLECEQVMQASNALLSGMTSEQFSIGADRPIRDSLTATADKCRAILEGGK